jgi:hypothetical protein
MKLYGYSDDDKNHIQTLSEVSIVASTDELLALSAFFAKCAYEIKNEGSWDHAHFHDFVCKTLDRDIDIIVSPIRS